MCVLVLQHTLQVEEIQRHQPRHSKKIQEALGGKKMQTPTVFQTRSTECAPLGGLSLHDCGHKVTDLIEKGDPAVPKLPPKMEPPEG